MIQLINRKKYLQDLLLRMIEGTKNWGINFCLRMVDNLVIFQNKWEREQEFIFADQG